MKRIIIIFLSLIPLVAEAQEAKIIGGYLLDGMDSFEELDAAVLTESRTKEKTLDGKGMKVPGGGIFMTPESVGKEIGSIVEIRHPFLVRTISFTVDENRMEGCRADIRIYHMHDEDNLENIITMPIHQDIPKAEDKTTFRIVPGESIVLDPGKYYISFCLSDIAPGIMERWAESGTWSEEERFAKYRQDRIFFPLYIKSSYCRDSSDQPLTKWGANIGMTVDGIIYK